MQGQGSYRNRSRKYGIWNREQGLWAVKCAHHSADIFSFVMNRKYNILIHEAYPLLCFACPYPASHDRCSESSHCQISHRYRHRGTVVCVASDRTVLLHISQSPSEGGKGRKMLVAATGLVLGFPPPMAPPLISSPQVGLLLFRRKILATVYGLPRIADEKR
jgi:hypothetical protein